MNKLILLFILGLFPLMVSFQNCSGGPQLQQSNGTQNKLASEKNPLGGSMGGSGNGEPYGGTPTYFAFEIGHTCKNASGNEIASPIGAIEKTSQGYALKFTNCTSAELTIHESELTAVEMSGGASVDFSDTVQWFNTELDGSHIVIHAETKLAAYDPQQSQAGAINAINSSTPWRAVISQTQPFLTKLNRSKSQIYLRKDMFTNYNIFTRLDEEADYYGELFTYDNQNIYLRTESFFDLASMGITDPDLAIYPSMSARRDKFRLFAQTTGSNKNTNPQRLVGGKGRIFAPRVYSEGWQSRQNLDIYACLNFSSFRAGSCTSMAGGSFEDIVSVSQQNDFDNFFDGVLSGYEPDSEFRHFDKVLIVTQKMGAQFQARERYYFGYRNNRFYGLIRWDASELNSSSQWITHSRTVGLRKVSSPVVSAAGIELRGSYETSAPVVNNDICRGEYAVNRLYTNYLKRTPSSGEVSYYLNEMTLGKTIKDLRIVFARSSEFSQINATNQAFVVSLYPLLLNRVGDSGGISYQLGRLNSGVSRAELVSGYINSPEFLSLSPCY